MTNYGIDARMVFDSDGKSIPDKIGNLSATNYTDIASGLEDHTTQLAQNANKIDGTYNVIEYGASPSKTTVDNKTALQSAISDVDSKGGGRIIIPYNIQYGFNRTDLTTHPDLSACVNDMAVLDFSKGDTYTTPSRDGSQIRTFFKTSGTQTDGAHDGNGNWIRSKWAPYLAISHDDSTDDNRRANYWLARDGVMMWGIGQGSQSGTGLTDDQKTDFVIMGNNINGGTGLTSMFNILKTNGYMGWNVNSPVSDFHFVTARGSGTNGTFRIENSKGGDLNIVLKTAAKFKNITLYNADASIKITNSANTLNIVTLYDNGNALFTGGVSGNSFTTAARPTGVQVGTMIFDTTLGKPVWLKTAPSTWVDATGTTV